MDDKKEEEVLEAFFPPILLRKGIEDSQLATCLARMNASLDKKKEVLTHYDLMVCYIQGRARETINFLRQHNKASLVKAVFKPARNSNSFDEEKVLETIKADYSLPGERYLLSHFVLIEKILFLGMEKSEVSIFLDAFCASRQTVTDVDKARLSTFEYQRVQSIKKKKNKEEEEVAAGEEDDDAYLDDELEGQDEGQGYRIMAIKGQRNKEKATYCSVSTHTIRAGVLS